MNIDRRTVVLGMVACVVPTSFGLKEPNITYIGAFPDMLGRVLWDRANGVEIVEVPMGPNSSQLIRTVRPLHG